MLMAAACGQVHYSARWIKLQELFLFHGRGGIFLFHGRGGTPGRPPGLCLLGIFRRSIFIKPSPWGEGAPVRTLGRMRGQSEKQASLEELCRGGVLTARPAFPNFAGEFRRPGGELLCPWRQSNQNATGDAADGLRLRDAPPRSIGPLSPDPVYEGRVPVR